MDFNCYIDESGDEGIETGGTRWFILGALIVPRQLDLQASTMVHRIKVTLGKTDKQPLHWSAIRNHNKRLHSCQELLTEGWAYSCVVSDKEHDRVKNADGLTEKWYLYFYSTRLLFERLSWYARDVGHGKAFITFEKRKNMSYDQLREYFQYLRGWHPPTEIAWDHLHWMNFDILPKTKSRLLQAVDCINGAVSAALEYSHLGFVEPRYVLGLKDRFYRRQTNLFSYGLKFLHLKTPTSLMDEYPWLKEM